MKLYIFDSCLYCTRVRAFLGFKGINCEVIPLAAGQLPVALEAQTNGFRVPVLETDDGQAIWESLDIIRYLDQLDAKPILSHYRISMALESWFSDLRTLTNRLCYPRMLALSVPELSSPESVNFFTRTRQQVLGCSFEQALASTNTDVAELEKALLTLASSLDLNGLMTEKRCLSIDDLVIFAELRTLSMVAELQLPDKLLCFQEYLSRNAQVSLFPAINQQGVRCD